MISRFLFALVFAVASVPVSAQQQNPKQRPAAREFEQCVDVEIGGQRSAYNCINQMLQRKSEQTRAAATPPPFSAGSQDIKIGAVNSAAVAQQYGRNYGVSAIPFRPPAIYSSPVGPRR